MGVLGATDATVNVEQSLEGSPMGENLVEELDDVEPEVRFKEEEILEEDRKRKWKRKPKCHAPLKNCGKWKRKCCFDFNKVPQNHNLSTIIYQDHIYLGIDIKIPETNQTNLNP